VNLFQIGAWIERHVPRDKYLTDVQHEVIKSALLRDDTAKAKQMLIDWKVIKP
jgi:hypothetical protein